MNKFITDPSYNGRRLYVYGFVHWVAQQVHDVTHKKLSANRVYNINRTGNGDLMTLLALAEKSMQYPLLVLAEAATAAKKLPVSFKRHCPPVDYEAKKRPCTKHKVILNALADLAKKHNEILDDLAGCAVLAKKMEVAVGALEIITSEIKELF
jgi:hypothetical protein